VLGRIEEVLESVADKSVATAPIVGETSVLPGLLAAEQLFAGVAEIPRELASLVRHLGYEVPNTVKIDFPGLGTTLLELGTVWKVLWELEPYRAFLAGPYAELLVGLDRDGRKEARRFFQGKMRQPMAAIRTLLARIPEYEAWLEVEASGLTPDPSMEGAAERAAIAALTVICESAAYVGLREELAAGRIQPEPALDRLAADIRALAESPGSPAS